MDRIIVAALLALALPGSVYAEPEIESAPASEVAAELVRSFVFEAARGPRRVAPDLEGAMTVVSIPAAVFSWVSPVFIWLEPGYGYAETSISFE